MPLTAKGQEIMAEMKKKYGEKKGEEVFYASRNKGTITGVDSSYDDAMRACADAIQQIGTRFESFVARRRKRANA